MKSFVCVVLLAAMSLAAPEGKRDKRGFLHGFSGGLELGHSSYHLGHYDDHAHISYHAPARIISTHKVVEVPKVVEYKKIVSVPRVVSVPHVVKVSKIVEDAHFAPVLSHGWW
ncbi:uncharacterized protein LOC116770610 [Danaus plexippus]|uniref:Uncharacterized protein n=1 Tax=Danaus plexippus plexippus TaxID=278856 RepID=A0A212F2J1_DANPL|nr:uncharacterized protein LOC116770610 [Danaus plexippus]OWR47957.1 hypothetical protein KGM_213983 [Danaus plexippus plexippus]